MDFLVLGGAGQVGTELQALAWPVGVLVHAPSRAELDITDPGAVARTLDARAYRAVINTAAYTAVDKAESDVVEAWRLNALAPAILARVDGRRSLGEIAEAVAAGGASREQVARDLAALRGVMEPLNRLLLAAPRPGGG